MSAVRQCRPGYGSAQGSHKASEGTKGCEKKEGACADTHLVTPHSIASAIKIPLKKSPEIRSKMAGEINVGGFTQILRLAITPHNQLLHSSGK